MVCFLLEVWEVVQISKINGLRDSAKIPTRLISVFEQAVTELVGKRETPPILVSGSLWVQL
jgi:hypothetical protein